MADHDQVVRGVGFHFLVVLFRFEIARDINNGSTIIFYPVYEVVEMQLGERRQG